MSSLRTLLAAGLAGALAATLAACGTAGPERSGVQVVTSLYPLQYVAERVAGSDATVTNLVAPGREPHDLELSIEQTARLSDADLVVHLRGFQPAVDEAVDQESPEHVLDVAPAADLRDDGAGEPDPHFWLDPARVSAVAVAVQKALAEADPAHADGYAHRLATLRSDLGRLDADYRRGLAACRTDGVVVTHAAFGYLSRYGLRLFDIVGLSPEAEPSPEHLAQLERLVRKEHVTTVFSEPLTSAQPARTLAAELGLRTAVLDPLEGLSDRTRGADYLSLMRRNLAALQEANGCR